MRRRPLWWACVLVLVLHVPYVASLLPGAGPDDGFDPLLDGWLNGLADAAVLGAVLLRALTDRAGRAGWLCIAAALACALAGSALWAVHYRLVPSTGGPTWSDAGWLAFYALLFVGLVLLLRERVHRRWAGVWLDGCVAGLAAAAVAVALVREADPAPAMGSAVDLAWLYPVGDLVLLAVAAAALAVLGRAGDLTWWLLGAAFVTFAVTDWVYAGQVARGDYVAGGPLELGFTAARLLLLAAAVTSTTGRAEAVASTGDRMLAVPAACGLVALGVLFAGTATSLPASATVLALAAGVAVVGRTALVVREVRELAEVTVQARTDDLTGLANRRHFYDSLRTVDAAGDGDPCAVLLVDLDRFKEVNDSLGHHSGDELLRAVGQRLATAVAGDGVLARLGGDEYAVLLRGVEEDGARRMAERMRTALDVPFALGPASIVVDGSVGIALAPQHGATAQELLQLADLAMYAAKAGRQGIQVYDEARDGGGRHRLELVTELRDAIGSGQLVLHYQPQVDLRSGRVTGVEALVRWQHPVHGLLGPAAFLGLAESAGLMGRLTTRVLEDALGELAAWRADGLDVRVAVNVSPSVLVDREFPAQVDRLLARRGVPGAALVLEVTEELLMDNRGRTVEALALIRRAGVQVSIDDYGTGYSSLAYLKDLPVTELKLDRSFVASMGSSPRSAAIVESTVELAHALGLALVAEGVEDDATLDALGRAGCDLAQGYLLGRPAPAAVVADVVRRADARARSAAGIEPSM
jgi:diguanylate cyclase